MCGIAGIWGGHLDALPAMRDALAHRGPDGFGLWEDMATRVALGHRRLAVVDIAGGVQPFVADDGQTVLVYNGEIYNHLELRAELESLGHRFRTGHSDTETVLHSWLEWGEEAPCRFNGMFAFAIWDKRANILFLARDRFGEKPLFWTASSQGFAFASELQALFPSPGFSAELDAENLQRYFAWGYFTGNRTLYRNTYSLPPGSWLKLDLSTGERREKRYWRFALEPDEGLTDADEPALVEELRALLGQAVERRLMSDVPFGVFLSGGIDSSAILEGMSRVLPAEQIHAFTVGFTEKSFDESGQAADTANFFGVRHYLRTLAMDEAQERIPGLLGRTADPLGDASLLPSALLAQFTREHVTVALSGDGGDELFAGYAPFKALQPAAIYSRIVPRPLHGALRRMAEAVPPSDANMSLDFKIRRTLRGLSYGRPFWLPVWMSPAEPAEIRELFERPLNTEELYEDALDTWKRNRHLSLQDQALAYFTEHYLSQDILVKVDRAAMLSSLESRAVFLDNDLVDFCRKLPFHFKMRGGTTKYLLKKALEGRIPQGVIRRPKKGFGIPLNRWLRFLVIRPPQAGAFPGVDPETVRRRIVAHKAGKSDYRLFLWAWHALTGRHCMPQQDCQG